MKKIGKKYKSAKEAIPAEKQSKSEAISLCKNNAPANFDESICCILIRDRSKRC